MATAFIGIGSNVGDRESFCRRAVGVLHDPPTVRVEKVSSLYETSPLGGPPQRSFINAVARISTNLSPRGLLETCRAIEERLGRGSAGIRWGPRVIDVDILLFDDVKISEPDLEIPHPRMTTRAFVLVPLLEVDPDVTDPWGARFDHFLDEAEGDVRLAGPFGDPTAL